MKDPLALSDRLHPVLVRDLSTALRGRAYITTMAVACLAVLGIAAWAVERDARGLPRSPWVLEAALFVLIPIVWFVIPLRAFTVLRDEVESGTADGLVLTELPPSRIVLGLVEAAFVQALLFLAVFAPLFALSYQLLAVDVYTLLQLLWLLLLGSTCMTSLGLATLGLTRYTQVRPHLPALAICLLLLPVLVLMLRIPESLELLASVSRAQGFGMAAARQVSGLVLLSAVLCMVGASSLTRFEEQRVVILRSVGLLAAPVVTLLASSPWMAVCLLAPFWLRAITDAPSLTRRQRVLVPLNRRDLRRVYILLPGAARGWLYSIALAALVTATTLLAALLAPTSPVSSMGPPADPIWLAGVLAGLDLIWIAGFATHYRYSRFGSSRVETESARFRVALVACFSVVLIHASDNLLVRSTRFGVYLLAPVDPLVGSGGYPAALIVGSKLLLCLLAYRALRRFLRQEWSVIEELLDAEAARTR